jgi:hypothetical protein
MRPEMSPTKLCVEYGSLDGCAYLAMHMKAFKQHTWVSCPESRRALDEHVF